MSNYPRIGGHMATHDMIRDWENYKGHMAHLQSHLQKNFLRVPS